MAAKAEGFICYGKGFAYTTQAPDGWVLDNKSEERNGICLVGYPKGGSWENSETVVYVNATPKGKKKGSRNLAEMVAFDIEQHKARNPKITIKEGEKFLHSGRKIASKYFFNGEGQGGFEAVAYIDEPKAGVFIVMNSRTEAGFNKSLPALRAFVENYHLITSDVEIKKAKRK